MATHSSIPASSIPWAEEPRGLLSMGLHRVGHDWSDLAAAAAAAYTAYTTQYQKNKQPNLKKKWTEDLNRHFSKEDTQMTKHMKRYVASLTIEEMQIKTTMKYHLLLVRTATIKQSINNKYWRGCGEKGTHTIGGIASQYSHDGEQYGGSSEN